jgi:hypothetical protein
VVRGGLESSHIRNVVNKFCVSFLILSFFLLSGERPSIDTSEQTLTKRKAPEDHVEFKKKRKKKGSKTVTQGAPIFIDLAGDMPTTSGTEMSAVCLL